MATIKNKGGAKGTNGKLPDPPLTNGYVPPDPIPSRLPPPLPDAPVQNGRPMSSVEFQQYMDLVHNETTSRREWMNAILDPRRDLEQECGFPRLDTNIPVDLYKQLYERDPICARVVECEPKESWQGQPSVYEDEDEEVVTQFEEAWDGLGSTLAGGSGWYTDEKGSRVWDYLMRADVGSRVGSFGILLLGFEDGLPLDQPVDGVEEAYSKIRYSRDERGKVVGAKVDVEKKGPVRPDSPMKEEEEEFLKERGTVNVSYDQKSGTVTNAYRPLNARERAVVDRWRNERFVWNAAVTAGKDPRKPKPKVPLSRQFGQSGVDDSNPNSQLYAAWMNLGRSRTGGISPSGLKADPKVGEVPRDGEEPPPELTDGAPADPRLDGMAGAESPDALLDPEPDTDEFVPPGSDDDPFAPLGDGEEAQLDEDGNPIPVEPPFVPRNRLIYLRPYDESQVQVVRYEWDEQNPRFGMPVVYRVTLNDPREQYAGVGLPLNTVFVHWTRVIHLADNRGSSDVFGKPVMRAVLNNLLGLRKIFLADPEAYWKAAFTVLSIESNPQTGGDVSYDRATMRANLEQMFNSSQRWMVLRGFGAKPIAPTLVDPTPHVNAQVDAICMKIGVPIPVFKGYEIGEQASENNQTNWDAKKTARKDFYLTPCVIVPFVDRLVACGVLPEPAAGYSVSWPDVDSLTEKDQAAIASQNVATVMGWLAGNGEAALPLEILYTHPKFLGMTKEEAAPIILEAQRVQEEQLLEQQAMAEEQGMIPEAPDGMRDPEMEDADHEKELELIEAKGEAGIGADNPFGGGGGPPKGPPKPGGFGKPKPKFGFNRDDVDNAFCPTGEGGGVDPSCGKDEGGNSFETEIEVVGKRGTLGTSDTAYSQLRADMSSPDARPSGRMRVVYRGGKGTDGQPYTVGLEDSDGKTFGYLSVAKGGRGGYLHNVVIHPSLRGKGLGAVFYKSAFKALAQDVKMKTVRESTNQSGKIPGRIWDKLEREGLAVSKNVGGDRLRVAKLSDFTGPTRVKNQWPKGLFGRLVDAIRNRNSNGEST